MSLRAGAAARDISPRQPLFLAGYPHVPRLATGVHDPLLASALFFSNRQTSLLLISVDVLFIAQESTAFCRAAIAAECGVPESNILISATHTHSAPLTVSMLAWRDDPVVPAPDADYLDQFHSGIIQAARAACEQARPAELAVASARVAGVGGNRLLPDGPFDPEAGLLAVRSDGQLMALDVIYGMHPTVLHEDSRLVSSDFPHYARHHLGEAFPGLQTIYHTGPCGNLSPRYHVRGQTFSEAERLGRSLGAAVETTLRQLTDADFHADIPLAALRGQTELIPNRFPPVAEAEAALERARKNYARLQCEGAPRGALRTAECVVFGCEEGCTLARAQASGEAAALQEEYRHAEVQAFRIGEACVVGLPGEYFVEYGLELKAKATGQTFVASLANGHLQGYIVTPEAAAAGGYEAAFALYSAESGARVVQTALALINQLRP